MILEEVFPSTKWKVDTRGKPEDQLRLLCSPRESISVKRGIAKIDPEAFVTLMQVDSVWGFGKGFGDIKRVNNSYAAA